MDESYKNVNLLQVKLNTFPPLPERDYGEQGWEMKRAYCEVELTMADRRIRARFRPLTDLTAFEYFCCRAIITGAIDGSKLKFMNDTNILRHWQLDE